MELTATKNEFSIDNILSGSHAKKTISVDKDCAEKNKDSLHSLAENSLDEPDSVSVCKSDEGNLHRANVVDSSGSGSAWLGYGYSPYLACWPPVKPPFFTLQGMRVFVDCCTY